MEMLKGLGLSNSEAEIYSALIELGPSLASAIASKKNLNRAYTYDRLTKLAEKGLVSFIIRNRKKYFQATPPSRLLLILKEKEENIKNLIPKLLAVQKPSEKAPKVEVFIGKEGMKTVIEDELTGKEIYVLGARSDFAEILKYYRPGFHKRRVKSKIPLKVIYDEKDRKFGEETAKMPFAEVKFLPEGYRSPLTIAIYNNKTVLQLWSETMTAIMTEDEKVTDGFRKYFKLLWKIAKK